MIHRISEKIVMMLDQRGALKHSSKDVYVYGFDIAIYTYLSTLALFLIGWIGGYPLETILMISLYYSNQSLGGGYHASTHMRCFLTMVIGMFVFLFLMMSSYITPLPTHTRNVFLSDPLAISVGFTPKQEVPAQKSRSIYLAIPLFRFDPSFLIYRLHYPSFPSEHHANLLLSICFFCSFSNYCSYPTQGSYNTQAKFLNDKRHNF